MQRTAVIWDLASRICEQRRNNGATRQAIQERGGKVGKLVFTDHRACVVLDAKGSLNERKQVRKKSGAARVARSNNGTISREGLFKIIGEDAYSINPLQKGARDVPGTVEVDRASRAVQRKVEAENPHGFSAKYPNVGQAMMGEQNPSRAQAFDELRTAHARRAFVGVSRIGKIRGVTDDKNDGNPP